MHRSLRRAPLASVKRRSLDAEMIKGRNGLGRNRHELMARWDMIVLSSGFTEACDTSECEEKDR